MHMQTFSDPESPPFLVEGAASTSVLAISPLVGDLQSELRANLDPLSQIPLIHVPAGPLVIVWSLARAFLRSLVSVHVPPCLLACLLPL